MYDIIIWLKKKWKKIKKYSEQCTGKENRSLLSTGEARGQSARGGASRHKDCKGKVKILSSIRHSWRRESLSPWIKKLNLNSIVIVETF